jgi:hypothetical protein
MKNIVSRMLHKQCEGKGFEALPYLKMAIAIHNSREKRKL